MGNQAVGRLLNPTSIQRVRMSVSKEGAPDAARPHDEKYFADRLVRLVPELSEINNSIFAKVFFRVIYGRGDAKEGSTVVNFGVKPAHFMVRVWWPADDGTTADRVLATALHEVLLHVVPRWKELQKARLEGKKLTDVFPPFWMGKELDDESQRQIQHRGDREHADVKRWAEVLKAAMNAKRESLVHEVILDIYQHVGHKQLMSAVQTANISWHEFQGYLATMPGGDVLEQA
jgi:hypothetical protein